MTFSRFVLRALSYLVPAHERAEWLREWEAEVAYAWNSSQLHGPANELLGPVRHSPKRRTAHVSRFAIGLRCLGALEDAFWLRIRRRDNTMVLQDIRYAVRTLQKNPLFTVVVLLTLALGIGANTAIFTLVDAVLLRPLPVAHPEEITDVYTTCRAGFPWCTSSYPDFLDYRDRNNTFAGMAAYGGTRLSVDDGESATIAGGMLVTGNYFTMLGVNALHGRTILPDDDHIGDPRPVILLSHRMWMNEFAGDEGIIGRDLRLNGSPFTVVGVAPKKFRGTRLNSDPDLWLPFSSLPLVATGSRAGNRQGTGGSPAPSVLSSRGTRFIALIGRRKPNVTNAQALADLLALSSRMQEENPRARGGRSVTVEATRTYTLPRAQTGEDIVRFVTLLLTVVGASLLIACANIANLMLSRASARRREIGMRIALGADRGRLVKQLITESLVLSVAGAAAGLFVASMGLKFLSGYALPGFVSIASLDLQLDGPVLAFTGGIAILTGLLFGVIPAIQTTNPNLTVALKEQSADPRSRGIAKTRSVLLAIQTALALVLLIGAGLFLRSLKQGLDADVGFETRRLAMATFDLSTRGYTEEQAIQFVADLTARAEGMPTARQVSSSVFRPLAGSAAGFFIHIDGYNVADGEELRIEANWVGSGYFRTMGIPVTGRDITEQDRQGAPLVAVINETMARRWWSNQDPVGRTYHMFQDGSGPEVLIVGVAQDVKYGLAGDPEPYIYYPIMQQMDRALDASINLLVATDAPALQILPTLRSHIRELDSQLAISDLTTLQNRFADFLMPQRMGTTLLTTLGGLTVLLAVVGITGVVGYAVNQRRREIGIRLALGAANLHVLHVIVRGAVIPVAVGLGVGLVVAFGVTRLISNFMFGITPTDPAIFIAVPLLMLTVTLVAAYLPARRATLINPTEALRSE